MEIGLCFKHFITNWTMGQHLDILKPQSHLSSLRLFSALSLSQPCPSLLLPSKHVCSLTLSGYSYRVYTSIIDIGILSPLTHTHTHILYEGIIHSQPHRFVILILLMFYRNPHHVSSVIYRLVSKFPFDSFAGPCSCSMCVL